MLGTRWSTQAWLGAAALWGLLSGCDGPTHSCFVGGTGVSTPGGPVSIERLVAGDSVVCIDPKSGERSIGLVQSLERSTADEYLVVRMASGRQVGVTVHHPFWVAKAASYKKAGQFEPGDELALWNGIQLISDEVVDIYSISRSAEVYHLVIDREPHTFLVSQLVVHNKQPPPPPPVRVRVTSSPDDAGWVRVDDQLDQFLGQGRDTLLFAPEGKLVKLEAVPRVGWRFDHWEGTVSRSDTFVVLLEVEEDSWVTCFFDTLR